MTQPAKHTPGALHNGQPSLGQPCTCCILLRTGEPLESIHGEQPCADISRIELCPKHAAAPAMYEALKEIVIAVQEGTAYDYGTSGDWFADAQAALAQAEGKQ